MNNETWQAMLLLVEHEVTTLYHLHTPPYLVYHNLLHTQTVVKRAQEIAAHYVMPDDALFTLLTAAWFHDTGQLFTVPERHEAESARLSTAFLKGFPMLPAALVDGVAAAIRATKMPQYPVNLIDQILCDADLYHLGTSDFAETDKMVQAESHLRGAATGNWKEGTLKMMEAHTFHTLYCREKLASGKAANIAALKATDRK